MADISALDEKHESIFKLLIANKYSSKKNDGFFFFREEELMSTFMRYTTNLRSMIERTYKLWRSNYKAGMGTQD